MSGFTAATWNVFNGSTPKNLEPSLKHLLHRKNVGLLFMQEMTNDDNLAMLADHDLGVAFVRPQYVVAWKKDEWVPVQHTRKISLAETTFHRVGGAEASVDACLQRLRHRPSGKVLSAMSYHTPAHVQVANKPKNRIAALREVATRWKAIQKNEMKHVDAVLFAGDDNVDERLRHGPWGFMLKHATGLRQVQAPKATHGKVIKIDDFRERGLTVGSGWVMNVPEPDDHRVHGHHFGWR